MLLALLQSLHRHPVFRGHIVYLPDHSYPGVEVIGTAYPTPLWKAKLAQAIGYVQMGALAGVLALDKICEFAGTPVPDWYTTRVAPNKMVRVFNCACSQLLPLLCIC